LVERNEKTLRMVARAPDEPVHSVQLYGVDPAVVAVAVAILVDEIGVDHVDLNFGCPAPKVTRKGGGAALPAHPALYRQVVRAAVGAAGAVPVTIKMRMGLDPSNPTALTAALIAEAEGVAAVALHARTAEQRYSGPAWWGAIAELKQAVTSIPILGNGDIWEAEDAVAMQARTGCDGVVVGRGCLGRPWIFAELAAALAPVGAGPTPLRPPDRAGPTPARSQNQTRVLGSVAAVMVDHASLLAGYMGEPAGLRDFRKHTGWYLAGFPVGAENRRRLASVESLAQLDELLERLDPDVPLPDATRRLPRGHCEGPRPVALPDGWLDNPDDPRPPAEADLAVSGG
ncbi:MAG TPA: tRNA-dihydrouridine synthase, partial [Acidimicrobiales bacterium]|nr:tRNA-dihydrouridine synthase [Acidimicrobiales bacterium]